MATTSNYCKAYPASRFESFPGWRPLLPALVASAADAAEDDDASGRAEPDADPAAESVEERYYYLHDNYIVTAGIFVDEDVAFADVTPEWKRFCDEQLEFAIPPDAFD